MVISGRRGLNRLAFALISFKEDFVGFYRKYWFMLVVWLVIVAYSSVGLYLLWFEYDAALATTLSFLGFWGLFTPFMIMGLILRSRWKSSSEKKQLDAKLSQRK